ncbi:MAG TPA: hypothetical protein VJM32_03725 [Candidatus Saccharimonadales bacterium]|nr:hypothetical protein [Candidatus Saccharimonadales bacterium]
MPEIIGQDPKRKARCNNCGSELSFRLDEVKAGDPIPHDDEGEHHSVITCPKCRKSVNVTAQVGPATAQQVKQARDRDYDDYL